MAKIWELASLFLHPMSGKSNQTPERGLRDERTSLGSLICFTEVHI